MMRLLITGWHGQVARSLAEAAPGRGDVEACAIGRPALDICEMKTITRALADMKPDVVINTAAYTAVDKAEDDEAAAFALNRDGAGMLSAAAAERGAAIIHLSTDYVFNGEKPAPYCEDDPPDPVTVYGRSKLAGEQAVMEANPRHIILRTAWVYSPIGTNFVKTMLRLAESRREIDVVSDQIGNPTYAAHLANAILTIAGAVSRKPEQSRWGIYHCTGGGEASWYKFAEEIFVQSEKLGGPVARVKAIPSRDYPTRAQRPSNSRLDCSRLKSQFDLSLSNWRSGVADCVRRVLR